MISPTLFQTLALLRFLFKQQKAATGLTDTVRPLAHHRNVADFSRKYGLRAWHLQQL